MNGSALVEPYVKLAPGATAPTPVPFDITVPQGSLRVEGDNRNSSKDSRYNTDQPGDGFVPLDNVVGRVFLRMWPFDRFGPVDGTNAFAGVPDPESSE